VTSPHHAGRAAVRSLSGIDEAEAEGLRQAFGIVTIGDLGGNVFVRAAVAIREMAKVAQSEAR
jgi:hypothetical protein